MRSAAERDAAPATVEAVFGRLNPNRAKTLQDRRLRYERRARSIRYGSVRSGSFRHLLQVHWRTLSGLRHPLRLGALLAGAAATVAAGAGLGYGGPLLVGFAAAGLVGAFLLVAVVTWVHERFRAGSSTSELPVIAPGRHHRRAPQDSSRPPAP